MSSLILLSNSQHVESQLAGMVSEHMESSECNTTAKATMSGHQSSDPLSDRDLPLVAQGTLLVLTALLDRRCHVVIHRLWNQRSQIPQVEPSVHSSPTASKDQCPPARPPGSHL